MSFASVCKNIGHSSKNLGLSWKTLRPRGVPSWLRAWSRRIQTPTRPDCYTGGCVQIAEQEILVVCALLVHCCAV